MDLDFTADQDELRDSVRNVLAKECPISLVRELVEAGTSADALWAQMTELGWPALTIAEEHGGLGLGFIELAVVAEELGRVIAPGPLLATVAQFAPLVREAGTSEQQLRFLSPVAEGTLTGSSAISEASGSWDPADVSLVVEDAPGGGVILTGEKIAVVEGSIVDEYVVVGRRPGTSGDDGIVCVVVPRSSADVRDVPSFDAARHYAAVTFDHVEVSADRVLGDRSLSAATAVRRAVEEATVAGALETVGVCQSIFDITLEYAKAREQFGVPIGSFQAIKHKFANMAVALERARSTGYFAALTIAEDDPRRSLCVSVAKAAAGDAQRLIAQEGIQIHGGIGYTWEADIHLYVRRAKAGEALLGSARDHRARIAAAIGL